MHDIVIAIANNIIQELKNDYNISEGDLIKLNKKIEDIKLCLIDSSEEEICYEFYTENNELYSSFFKKQIGQSHTADYPPIWKNGEMIRILPIINLVCYTDREEFISSAYHELVHFLSIGSWNILSNKQNELEHFTGIIKNKYIYEENEIKCKYQEITMLNEVITDWIAQYLYFKIERKTYHSGMRYINSNFNDNYLQKIKESTQEKYLIGAYMMNKIDILEKLLLNGSVHNNFESINSEITKQK